MIMRILVTLCLIVLAGGFIFFVGNIIWLGTKEFFKIYGPQKSNKSENENDKNNNKETNNK